MHRPVRLAALTRVQADETVQQLPLLLQGAVQGRGQARIEAARRRGIRADLAARLSDTRGTLAGFAHATVAPLTRLALHEQLVHVLGFEQARQAQELLLFGGARHGELPELLAVEEHPVEVGDRSERLVRELLLEVVGCLVFALGLGQERVFEPVVVARLTVEGVVALALHLAGEAQQHRHVRQEHRRRLAATAGPHEAADGLREEQRGRRARGVDAHRETRHVDALRDHAHRHHPARPGVRERLDAARGGLVVGEHDRRRFARDPVQDRGVRPRGGLVGRDDEAAGVGHVLPHLAEAAVGAPQYRGNPVAFGVECRAPRLRGDVFRVVLPEVGLELVTGFGAPAHLARVDEEQHGPHDAVGEGAAVAVVVVGAREPDALLVRVVLHERDRGGVAAERCAAQQQASGRAPVRLTQRIAPAERVAAVVHLVEDHERRFLVDEPAVHGCLDRDLRIGDRNPVEVPGVGVLPVAEARIESDAHTGRGVGPLGLQVLGGSDHHDALDHAAPQELGGQTQREGRLAGAGGRRGEEVAGALSRAVRSVEGEVLLERFGLPRAQVLRRSPRRALRERGRQVLGGEAAELGRVSALLLPLLVRRHE